jgi:hypothetical protein
LRLPDRSLLSCVSIGGQHHRLSRLQTFTNLTATEDGFACRAEFGIVAFRRAFIGRQQHPAFNLTWRLRPSVVCGAGHAGHPDQHVPGGK